MIKRIVQIDDNTKIVTLFHDCKFPEMYLEVGDKKIPFGENKIPGLRNMMNEAYYWYQMSLEQNYGN